jgi:hypothetical protein
MRRFDYDDEARMLNIFGKPLGDDWRHDLVTAVDAPTSSFANRGFFRAPADETSVS